MLIGQVIAVANVESQGRRTIAAQEDQELAELRSTLGSLWDPEERAKWREGSAAITEWHAAARRRVNSRTYQLATQFLKLYR